jgi:glycerophosphoryl diester phosphodiesterase
MEQTRLITPQQRKYAVRIEGHRGAGRLTPDNSIKGFQKAIELQLEGVELDVWLSVDSIPIVLHGLPDATVELKDGSTRKINEIHSKELKDLILADGESIPTLEEVFDVCKDKVCINIELKEAREDTIEKVLLLLKEKDMFNQIDFSSFQHINKEYLTQYSEKLGIQERISFGFLMAIDKYNIPNYSKELAGDTINIDYRIIMQQKEDCIKQIELAKSNGMGVKIWFPRKIFENISIHEELFDLKVDTIITDEPIALIGFLNDKKQIMSN